MRLAIAPGVDAADLTPGVTVRLNEAMTVLEVSSELAEDSPLARGLAAVDDLPTRLAVSAERAVLARLEAGCAAPVGTYGRMVDGDLHLDVVVANPDGTEVMRRSEATDELSVEAAKALGVRIADELLADGADRLARLTL